MAEKLRAQGDRSVVVGRDVINSIINTGDHNQFFIGDYERLRDAYIEPWSVFEQVNLDHFVGREWLLAKVDAFLRDHHRGYFILEAEAGLGKTTFLAWLVQERGYIHHFIELAPGLDGVGRGLKNLAAQLVLAYHLSAYEAEGVLPSAATQPDFLYKLLKQASDQRHEGEKIVLVVDALDEAGTPPNQNVLGLPSVLPEGVYVIVSQRPVMVTLQVDTGMTPRHPFHLTADSNENQLDMRHYLERAAAWTGIAQALQASGYTAEQFVTTLLEKCSGVWIYLHFVIHEIERGERSPLDLDALPDGMTQYYTRYWQRWRDEDEEKWDEVYLPLLTTLAAAQEAVTAKRLVEWANVQMPLQFLHRLLNERWRPFLAIWGQAGKARYRLYHATLREFCEGKVAQDDLKLATELSFTNELVTATRQAHNRLVERYLSAWGGLENSLSGLQEASRRDIDEGYGLRHLAAHLETAGRAADLHQLLRLEWAQEEELPYNRRGLGGWLDRLSRKRRTRIHRQYENVWYVTREAIGETDGYLADVTRAWRLAEGSSTRAGSPIASGLQCRYALIVASINSQAMNTPPDLLAALIAHRLWNPAQGLTYIRHLPHTLQQVTALDALLPYLPHAERAEAVQQVLAKARVISDEGARAEAIVWLAPHLPQASLQETLAEVRVMADEWALARALTGLAPYLSEVQRVEVIHEALAAARTIEFEGSRSKALAGLAPHLPEPLKEDVLKEALAAARMIEFEGSRSEALAGLAPHMPEWLLQEALREAHRISDERDRAKTLVGLAPHLPEDLLQEVFVTTTAIRDHIARADGLVGLAPHLSEALLRQTLAAVQAIKLKAARAAALAKLVPYLPEAERAEALPEALAAARTIPDNGLRAEVLLTLVPYLTELERKDVLREALDAAHARGGWYFEKSYRETLIRLAPHLSEDERVDALREALDEVRGILDAQVQAETLVGLAPYLPEALLGEVLTAARAIGPRGRWSASTLFESLLWEQMDWTGLTRHAKALTKLAPYLSKSQRADALREALTAARSIPLKLARAKALTELIPHLGEPDRRTALRLAVATVRKVDIQNLRPVAFIRLIPHLPEPLKRDVTKEALATARTISDQWARGEALVGLLPHLSKADRAEALREALTAAQAVEDELLRAEMLVVLAPYPSDTSLREALSTAYAINTEWARARAVTELDPYLSETDRAEILRQALGALAVTPEYGGHYSLGIGVIGMSGIMVDEQLSLQGFPVLSRAERVELWQSVVWGTQKADRVKEAFFGLAMRLPEEILPEALTTAQAIKAEPIRAAMLAGLAPRLPEAPLGKALDTAQQIEEVWCREKALKELAPALAQLPHATLFRLWQETLPHLARRTRENLLMDFQALAAVIAKLGGEAAFVEIFRAIQDVGRWWP